MLSKASEVSALQRIPIICGRNNLKEKKRKKGEKKNAIGVSLSMMGTIYALLSLTNPWLLAVP